MKKDYRFPVIKQKEIFSQEKTAKKRFGEKLVFLCMIHQYCAGKKHGERCDCSHQLEFDEELESWMNKKRKFTPALFSFKLCPSCYELLKEVTAHTRRCPHMAYKSFCHHCPRPCYKKERLDLIIPIMGYSGPRLMLRHPILASKHLAITIKSLKYLKQYEINLTKSANE